MTTTTRTGVPVVTTVVLSRWRDDDPALPPVAPRPPPKPATARAVLRTITLPDRPPQTDFGPFSDPDPDPGPGPVPDPDEWDPLSGD